MIDDFGGPSSSGSRKPKRIEPLEKPQQKSVLELAAEQESFQALPNPADTTFVTPDEAATQDTPSVELPVHPSGSPSDTTTHTADTSHKTSFLNWSWPLSKKWTVIAGIVASILIGGGATFAYLQQPDGQGGVYISKRPPKPAPKDTRVPNSLTGSLVDPTVNQRPVIGVMIENSTEARPQSGLDQAGIVFEAIAEGGITRFLALFQDTEPGYIGPIRSARPYYVQWCMSFDCAYAHAGGSPEALQNISAWGTKDLNHAGTYFWRVSSRYAPHNLYSSGPKLSEYAASRGYTTPSFTGFVRKKDEPYKAPAPQKNPTDTRRAAPAITLSISSQKFNSRFDYDAATNTYIRSQAGAPHTTIDEAGNQTQIRSKVVVALATAYGIAYDGHSQYGVVGTGQAIIFQDGTASEATWSKPSITAPLKFVNAAGADIPINAGQTWVTTLGNISQVAY